MQQIFGHWTCSDPFGYLRHVRKEKKRSLQNQLKAEDSTTATTPRALILSENVTALSRATALLIVVCQLASLVQRGYTDASTGG